MDSYNKKESVPRDEELTIDIDAHLIFEHIGEKPSTEDVKGVVKTTPSKGTYDISLAPTSEKPFIFITGWICVVVIIFVILDWPKEANGDPPPPPPDDDDDDDEDEDNGGKEEGKKHGFYPDGARRAENFLTLSGGEYSGVSFLRLKDGWALKKFEMTRIGRKHFKATVETTHHYPKAKTEKIARLLPNDITMVDAGLGKAYGRTQVRWLNKDGSIEVGDMQINFAFKNKKARIPFPQVFSYEYGDADITKTPFRLKARGTARSVDNDNCTTKK